MHVLVMGGYGVVGRQIATLLAQRHPSIRLTLGGRSESAARAAAGAIPEAEGLGLDVTSMDPLSSLAWRPDLIVAAVNDDHDQLLAASAKRDIPLVDITRWTARMQEGAARLLALPAHSPLTAPIVFASSWMAGIAATLAREAASTLATVERIDIDILYALKDRSGPNSVAYMDRLGQSFPVMEKGRPTWARPMSDPRTVAFRGGPTARAARFDAPDQFTLPTLTGARTVATRIAFDDPLSSKALQWAVRSGLWGWLSGPRFSALRRAMLHNPGEGAPHRFEISVLGTDALGAELVKRVSVVAPQGQTYLTALGAVIQVERVFGLSGHLRPTPGLQVAEASTDGALMRRTLEEAGIQVFS